MMEKVQNVENYEFTSDDRLFLDTNIWLSILCPQLHTQSRRPREHIYTSAWGRILKSGGRVYTNILVVSEFINTYARIRWDRDGREVKFKKFRNSKEFKPIARDIAKETGRILCNCVRINDSFDRLDVGALLDEFAQGSADFNDQIIREACRERNLTLVTDDGDFAHQGIPLLTANKRLLN